MIVAVEGSQNVCGSSCSMLSFDPYGPSSQFIDIASGGTLSFTFTAQSNATWLLITPSSGTIGTSDIRLEVSVDWAAFGSSSDSTIIEVQSSSGQSTSITVHANMTAAPSSFVGFIEGDGTVTIEAEHFAQNNIVQGSSWVVLPGYGKTLSAITSFPPTSGTFQAGSGPNVEYDFYTFNSDSGQISITTYVSPSQNTNPSRQLAYAVQVDSGPLQTVLFMPFPVSASTTPVGWDGNDGFVANAIVTSTTVHSASPGAHTLRIFMIEPAVVLQKVVINTGGNGVRTSYLGPPESSFIGSSM